jgi:hypothetical protein
MTPATVGVALNVHDPAMTSDQIVVYFGTTVRLAGVNRFYMRRVLQRCERGEITLREAADLLMRAAQGGEAQIGCEGLGVGSGS